MTTTIGGSGGTDWCWQLLESIGDGLVVIDAAMQVVYVNRVTEALVRMGREQLVGRALPELLPRGNLDFERVLRACAASEREQYLREVRPAGRIFGGRVFDVWTYPMPAHGLAIRFEDVSERVRREEELARLAVEAQEANRAKSRFFAAVSHELRTPLNAIVGYAHLLGSGTYGNMPPAARRAAERTGVCAEHLARLVDDVLLMTTTEVGRLPVFPAPTRLDEFVPRALQPLRMQAEAKGLGFHIRFHGQPPVVLTDPDRLRQLLGALVSNAIKFTPQGEIAVEIHAPGGPEAPMEIAVVDTGPGIPAEARERIFDAFEQLGDPSRPDSATRGTGLGLTIARQLAALLGYALSVDDAPAGGARFTVRIPPGDPLESSAEVG